jgi:hypothetical protein
MKTSMNYKLRAFEPGNPEEIERMNLMFYHPQVMKAKGYWHTKFSFHQDMFGTPATISRQVADVSYAIADLKNDLVGWVWFYQESKHPLPTSLVKKYGLTKHNSRIYQVSYEKLMSESWPRELIMRTKYITKKALESPRKGVVVAGLGLAIRRLTREYRLLYKRQRKLALYGFVLPENIASAEVLRRNEFVKVERQYRYNGVKHDLWVRVI